MDAPTLPLTPTSPTWLAVALADLDTVHQDHLHCERKAAQSALSLVRSYPDRLDLVLAACVLAAAPGYSGLMLGAVLCGIGNAPFHPVDYSILNARISPMRLGKAYAIHGVSGSLGWALAPVLLATVAQFAGWRIAFLAAGLVALSVMGAVWKYRALMQGVGGAGSAAHAAASAPGASTFGILRLPASIG